MKIPVLPAVVLCLLALHSARGAALGSSKVSASPGFSFSCAYSLTALQFLYLLTIPGSVVLIFDYYQGLNEKLGL